MNKNLIILMILLVGIAVVVYVSNDLHDNQDEDMSASVQALHGESEASTSNEEYVIDESDFVVARVLLNNLAQAPVLSDAELAGLLLMREEEKLARDVYTTLGTQWGIQIFSNIAQSEQTHMDTMKYLLDTYKLTDPVTTNDIGIFTDARLQDLYTALIAQGRASQSSALTVGATIEDLDIYDLNRLMAETDKLDILTAYKNLQKGSRNHLRAFNKQIVRGGSMYAAQYISAQQLLEITSSTQEKGVVR